MRRPLPILAALVLTALASTAAAQDTDASGEAEILGRINAMRNAAQLGPVVRDEALDAAALVHSQDMAAHGELVHVSDRTGTPADRVHQQGLSPRAMAENVAFAPDALEAHRQLVASEAHRTNMMTPRYTHVGISVVQAEDGVYVTEVFAELPAADAEPEQATEQAAEPEEERAAEPPAEAPVAPAPWTEQGGEPTAAPDAPPAPAPGGEVQAEPLPEAQAEQAPAIRAPAQQGQRRVAGYWVYSQGRWWYYPLPPDARPGQVLQPSHQASAPPPGVYRQPGYRVYQPQVGYRPGYRVYQPPAGYRPGYRVYVTPRRAPAFGWSPRRHYYRWRYGR